MMPFTLQARGACPTHADLALAMAHEFHPVPWAAVQDELDELAGRLEGVRTLSPALQLGAVARRVCAGFDAVSATGSIDDLLLDRVLWHRAGHPLAIAMVCAEAGRRAGVPLGVVAGRDTCRVVHASRTPVLIDPARPQAGPVPTAGSPDGLRRQCAHQTTAQLLGIIARRARRTGHVTWAIRAAELRLELPFAGDEEPQLIDARDRARARLN